MRLPVERLPFYLKRFPFFCYFLHNCSLGLLFAVDPLEIAPFSNARCTIDCLHLVSAVVSRRFFPSWLVPERHARLYAHRRIVRYLHRTWREKEVLSSSSFERPKDRIAWMRSFILS